MSTSAAVAPARLSRRGSPPNVTGTAARPHQPETRVADTAARPQQGATRASGTIELALPDPVEAVSADRREVGIAVAMVANGYATRIRLCGLRAPELAAAAEASSAAAAGVSVCVTPGVGGGLEVLVAQA